MGKAVDGKINKVREMEMIRRMMRKRNLKMRIVMMKKKKKTKLIEAGMIGKNRID